MDKISLFLTLFLEMKLNLQISSLLKVVFFKVKDEIKIISHEFLNSLYIFKVNKDKEAIKISCIIVL